MSLSDLSKTLNISLPSPLEKIESNFIVQGQNIDVYCKRDDRIHPIISGNKWRKLAPVIESIKKNKYKHILSFGGGFSNHLHALAFICHQLNIRLTAIVRGDYSQALTPMLADIQHWGTNCHYVTKLEYKERTNPNYLQQLGKQFGVDYIIPEGGSNEECLLGVSSLVDEYCLQLSGISHVISPVASGGTLAGLIQRHAQCHQLETHNNNRTSQPLPEILGIGVLKGQGYLENLVTELLSSSISIRTNPKIKIPKWSIEHDYHHGGYAKSSSQLQGFIDDFQVATHIPVETVYSAKCFFALKALISKHRFTARSKIVIIHTGGLQGKRAIE